MHFVYILYSSYLNQYYIGETENVSERVIQHNTGFYSKSHTHKASDWQVFLEIQCRDRKQARKMEGYIKKMKSRKYIENLRTYPEMIEKIRDK